MGKRENVAGREFLNEIRESNKTIEILKQQIEIEEARVMDISVHYKDVQVQSSGSGNMMWEKVPEIVSMINQLENNARKLAGKKDYAISIIQQLKPRRQSVLVLYYIQGKTIEKAAEEMKKSYRWFWDELQAAVMDFSRIFEEKQMNNKVAPVP